MRKNIKLTLFPLILCGLLIACSNKSSNEQSSDNASSSASNNASKSSPSTSASTADFEPLMPEKVQVAFEQNCKSCHGLDGHGINGIAPDLRRSAYRNLADWIKYLKDEKGTHSSAKIPAMASLTDADYEALGGYLADLTQKNTPAASSSKK